MTVVSDFLRFSTVLMVSGVPTLLSRVLACLSTTDAGSLTASEPVQRLQVGPASVSKAVAFLESRSFTRRKRDDQQHMVLQRQTPRPPLAHRIRALAPQRGDQGVGFLGPGAPVGACLENVARSGGSVSESMTRAAEQDRDILCTKPETGEFLPPG